MTFPDEETLADALLWEEGVCLVCGAVSEPLEEQDRLCECEACGSGKVYPASMLLEMKRALEDEENLPF